MQAREGYGVAMSVVHLLEEMPGHGYWSYADDEAFEEWEALLNSARQFAFKLYDRSKDKE